jgi:hypothetical protein
MMTKPLSLAYGLNTPELSGFLDQLGIDQVCGGLSKLSKNLHGNQSNHGILMQERLSDISVSLASHMRNRPLYTYRSLELLECHLNFSKPSSTLASRLLKRAL